MLAYLSNDTTMKFEEILHHYQIRSYSEHGVTTQYLGRIVRQFTGKTVYHWICEALVREIAQLLSDTDASLQEIADQLHFSDQAVISKMFKRLQGIPPSVYRDQIARRRTELPAPHSVC